MPLLPNPASNTTVGVPLTGAGGEVGDGLAVDVDAVDLHARERTGADRNVGHLEGLEGGDDDRFEEEFGSIGSGFEDESIGEVADLGERETDDQLSGLLSVELPDAAACGDLADRLESVECVVADFGRRDGETAQLARSIGEPAAWRRGPAVREDGADADLVDRDDDAVGDSVGIGDGIEVGTVSTGRLRVGCRRRWRAVDGKFDLGARHRVGRVDGDGHERGAIAGCSLGIGGAAGRGNDGEQRHDGDPAGGKCGFHLGSKRGWGRSTQR